MKQFKCKICGHNKLECVKIYASIIYNVLFINGKIKLCKKEMDENKKNTNNRFECAECFTILVKEDGNFVRDIEELEDYLNG